MEILLITITNIKQVDEAWVFQRWDENGRVIQGAAEAVRLVRLWPDQLLYIF